MPEPAMIICSIALKTSLMIQRLDGVVDDKGDYAVLRTPTVPDFWYGNCLVLPRPPAAGDYERWMALFAAELPGPTHRVFLVDAPDGDCGQAADFLANGFEINRYDVLATDTLVRPERLNGGFVYRPLSGDRDWQAVLAASQSVNAGLPGYANGFLERRFASIRRSVEAGRGAWWAAIAGDLVVAHMGLFWEAGLVRFQDVETLPDYRRQGICRSLLYAACAATNQRLGAVRYVIVPADDTVRRIYESVGFSLAEQTVDFCRPPNPALSNPG
ncbi:MAG: hypothetical protein A2087_03765 [Spirochaetes bacterium GWD1_61_31]|nr:MAG: hypothetical protein A2Y37_05325 [Spirochaetes bacterium GWB1_60_80]OHD33248.1 MAG: hypothetical protein A2004_09455 [Spirochaetes bacterium GWC1_61_12]OHD35082.1 MAG: hypothetical protein A2087_03765 [Spirochaetes bacterium GWD1_61_31]OHD42752.1 MAG: hypothetical protein A2Y35_05705 [Spirochaetes bacterium GWE1_60_18]OHD58604.1 MAG: hypothetical protein A2Y32_04630 [Spirochaetes bacterium GWF1_60_12]